MTEEVHAPPLEWDKRPGRDATPIGDLIGVTLARSVEPGYEPLAAVLQLALDQAQSGKGRDRHSDNKEFHEQPIMEIGRMLGDPAGHAYQIMKKAQEANRMVKRGQHDAATRELYGVINYAAAAVLLIRELPEGVK